MLKKVLPKKLLLLLFLLYFISITKCDEYDVDYTEIDLNKYNKPISAKGLHNYYEITNIKISKKIFKNINNRFRSTIPSNNRVSQSENFTTRRCDFIRRQTIW